MITAFIRCSKEPKTSLHQRKVFSIPRTFNHKFPLVLNELRKERCSKSSIHSCTHLFTHSFPSFKYFSIPLYYTPIKAMWIQRQVRSF